MSIILGHLKPLIFHLSQMENQWFLGVPLFNYIWVNVLIQTSPSAVAIQVPRIGSLGMSYETLASPINQKFDVNPTALRTAKTQ